VKNNYPAFICGFKLLLTCLTREIIDVVFAYTQTDRKRQKRKKTNFIPENGGHI
jgi:hypothetical protein